MSILKKINRDAVKSVSRIGGVTILSPKDMGKILGRGGQCHLKCSSGEILETAQHSYDYPDKIIQCNLV